ncbi:MAG TPA: cytochrome c-type biogenesis protein [Gemmatimonadota bacterium]|nr:cytochrome c-type biogenesis protein [Gemmatimonadota bacterium]
MKSARFAVSTLIPSLAIGALLIVADAAVAQEPMLPAEPIGDSAGLTDPRAAELDARAADIAAQLRCPVCSGQSVLESNSAIAQEMQEVIRERLEQGEGEREVLTYFRGAYGDWIILRPRATGLNLLVYVLPAIALLGGCIWLVVVLRRWSAAGAGGVGGSGAAGEPDGDLSAEDEAWLQSSIGGR